MAVIPLVLATLLFYTYCNRAFAKRTEFVPLDQLRREGSTPATRIADGTDEQRPERNIYASLTEDPDAIEDYEDAITATAPENAVTPIETVVILPGQESEGDQSPTSQRVMFRGSTTRGRIRAFTGDQGDIGMSRHRLYINPAFSSDLPQPWLPVAVVSALPASDPLSLFAPLYEDQAAEAQQPHRHVGGVALAPGTKLEKMLVGSVRELEDLPHEEDDRAGNFADDDEVDDDSDDKGDNLMEPESLGQVFVSRLSTDSGSARAAEAPVSVRRPSMVSPATSVLGSSVQLYANAWESATPLEGGSTSSS
jgi:hypothetical protein